MRGSLTSFPGSLFSEFERLSRELDQRFEPWAGPANIRAVARGSFPALNVGLCPDSVDVYLFAPGLDPKSVDVSLEKQILTVSGRREAGLPEAARAYLQERFDGEFRRTLTLSEDVDPERVEARYQDGVLHIRAHRREATKPRQIAVQ